MTEDNKSTTQPNEGKVESGPSYLQTDEHMRLRLILSFAIIPLLVILDGYIISTSNSINVQGITALVGMVVSASIFIFLQGLRPFSVKRESGKIMSSMDNALVYFVISLLLSLINILFSKLLIP